MAALFGLLFTLGAAAQTILTENWTSANSNWTVASGTPAYGGALRNSDSDQNPSRLVYTGNLTGYDYSIESWLPCEYSTEYSWADRKPPSSVTTRRRK